MTKATDHFGSRSYLPSSSSVVYRINRLEESGIAPVSRLPFSIKVLLEALLRQVDGFQVTEEDVIALAKWNAAAPANQEIPFKPARVILQDFTGVPAVVDLAALRDAMAKLGGDPNRINPLIPVDLVIDHSVQVDFFGANNSLTQNMDLEFQRNRERYEFLRWAQKAFQDFSAVPPATGIIHQVNLEYLAKVVQSRKVDGETVLLPDSLVGTDSHTTMINGLGVLGWGVGGIEAEAAMLGQPLYMLMPEVIGFKLHGQLPEGATATDLALTITQMLRKKGVVGKFVEFYGTGLSTISLADRATIANMAPEYGATMGFFPVDRETLNYLSGTGRSEELIQTVDRYTKEQGLFRTDATPDPVFTDTLELDLSSIVPTLAGPKRPQDRVSLSDMKRSFNTSLRAPVEERGFALKEQDLSRSAAVALKQKTSQLKHGSVVIAAITSCTNTSNPSVMLGAGLLAKKAVERGLNVSPYVKTSLAPGSRVVSSYLDRAGLTPYLEKLGFYTVGYGCTTCIGNSGPLPEEVDRAIAEGDLVVSSVLSGNRNFEGRVHPSVKANYLASPPLVIAYALAGTVDIDMQNEPIGTDKEGKPVYLNDIWPSMQEIQETINQSLSPELFAKEYGQVFDGNATWNQLPVPEGELYDWDATSTYIQKVPFFENLAIEPKSIQEIRSARVLAVLGDSVTTDHISPAGNIQKNSPAGKYLMEHGVEAKDFNSYGARRGNHEVMMRGTFANIRIKNQLVPGVEGGVTRYLPTGEQMSIYDAAMQYQQDQTPLVILAGKEYGTGSSRDWAAKGSFLLGVKAVIAESFERIHRSNLVGMGVLPLQFAEGDSWKSLGLTGDETFDILGLNDDVKPQQHLTVRATRPDGKEINFQAVARLDTPVDVAYYRNEGILQTVLRNLVKESGQSGVSETTA